MRTCVSPCTEAIATLEMLAASPRCASRFASMRVPACCSASAALVFAETSPMAFSAGATSCAIFWNWRACSGVRLTSPLRTRAASIR